MNKKIQYFNTKSDSILKSPVNLVKKSTKNGPKICHLMHFCSLGGFKTAWNKVCGSYKTKARRAWWYGRIPLNCVYYIFDYICMYLTSCVVCILYQIYCIEKWYGSVLDMGRWLFGQISGHTFSTKTFPVL